MTSENSCRPTGDTLKTNLTNLNRSKMLEREHVSWGMKEQVIENETKWQATTEYHEAEEMTILTSKTEPLFKDDEASAQTRMDNCSSTFDTLATDQFNDDEIPQSEKRICKVVRSCNKIFTCSRCSYETDRKNNLKRHIATMHDPAPAALDCCGTRFATKGDLRDHTRSAHGAGYTCWQCGHTFCRRALLHRHQSVHSGLKAFSCSNCGYQSSHKSNMQRHMQVHLQFRGQGASGGTSGRNKEKIRSSCKINLAKVLGSNSVRSGASASSDSANCKSLSVFHSHFDDIPKGSISSFYSSVGETITSSSPEAVNPSSVIFPRSLLSKNATSTAEGLRNFDSKTINNFNDKRFSRALTTIKSIHLSQRRLNNNKFKTSINSLRPLANSCDILSSQTNREIRMVNPDVWRLAFAGHNEAQQNYQQSIEMLPQHNQANQRSLHFSETSAFDISKNPLLHESLSNEDTSSSSYLASHSRTSQRPVNNIEGHAKPFLLSHSRLKTTSSQSDNCNLPSFLPITSFQAMFPEPPNIASLQSQLGCNPSDVYETTHPPARVGGCGRRLLHRPIPTYPRPVTDFSVNSLLAKGVSRRASEDTSEEAVAAEHCQDLTQPTPTPQDAVPRDSSPSSSLLWAHLQTSTPLRRPDHRNSAFEQPFQYPCPTNQSSSESEECTNQASHVVDLSRKEHHLEMQQLSAGSFQETQYHRPENTPYLSCRAPAKKVHPVTSIDGTPFSTSTALCSTRSLMGSQESDRKCFEETHSLFSRQDEINQKLYTIPHVQPTHASAPYLDPNIPLDCSLPKPNNKKENHPRSNNVQCYDAHKRKHHRNSALEVSRNVENMDSKGSQSEIPRNTTETTCVPTRVIPCSDTSSDSEKSSFSSESVQECPREEKLPSLREEERNVNVSEKSPDASVTSHPQQYIPKKIRALNRSWQQATEDSCKLPP